MSENPQMHQPEATPETMAEQPVVNAEEAGVSTRRELVKRYGKYALAAGPLLLFVSKAHAIHSRP